MICRLKRQSGGYRDFHALKDGGLYNYVTMVFKGLNDLEIGQIARVCFFGHHAFSSE